MSSALLRGSASFSSLTDVLDSFPPSQNRYLALAGLLKDQLNVNYNSTGAGLVTLWICLIGQASVLILSALVSILRLKAGKFNFIALTRNKVIRPYAADCLCVVCALAAPPSIGCILGIMNIGVKVDAVMQSFLQAFSFLFIWLSTWAFFWSWLGSAICQHWDPPWNQVPVKLPPGLVCSLNVIIVGGPLAAFCGVLSTVVYFTGLLRPVLASLAGVIRNLERAAPSYDPNTWQDIQILPVTLVKHFIKHLML